MPVRVLLASLLLVVTAVPAQESRVAVARAVARPAPSWLEEQQAADGHWSAAAEDPARDVAMTALCLLAALADGSTLRTGPLRSRVVSATTWLRHQQGPDGSFGPPAADGALENQALATLALLHCAGLSDHKALRPAAQQALDALLPRVRPEERQYSPVVAAWTALAVDAARSFQFRVDPKAVEDLWPRGDPPVFAAGQELPLAAHLVLRTALIEAAGEHDPRLLALATQLTESERTRSDPLATWFLSWALYDRLSLSAEGARLWRKWRPTLRSWDRTAAERATGREPLPAPPGAWALAATRTGATALAMLNTTLWFRYCALLR